MRYVEDYSDERNKSWCIHCRATIRNIESNRDHVPTKSLLSKAMRSKGAKFDRGVGSPDDYLPQVLICRKCNSGFSRDEEYLLCVLHAVFAGSLYPDPEVHPEASHVLRSNRDIVRALKRGPSGEALLFDDLEPFALYPDPERIRRVVLKNARGHAYHEIGEPLLDEPCSVSFQPLASMTADQRLNFERVSSGELWPEVGSRMLFRVAEGTGSVGGWIEVERNRYRYAVDWSAGVTVRTVIWDYLATETHWDS